MERLISGCVEISGERQGFKGVKLPLRLGFELHESYAFLTSVLIALSTRVDGRQPFWMGPIPTHRGWEMVNDVAHRPALVNVHERVDYPFTAPITCHAAGPRCKAFRTDASVAAATIRLSQCETGSAWRSACASR